MFKNRTPPIPDRYQRLLDLAERLETIEAVREGLESMRRGEGRPLGDVFAEIEKELTTEQSPGKYRRKGRDESG